MDVAKYVPDGYKCVKDVSTTTVTYKVEQIGNDELVVKADEGTPNGKTSASLDGGFNGNITTVTNSNTISGATVTSVGQKGNGIGGSITIVNSTVTGGVLVTGGNSAEGLTILNSAAGDAQIKSCIIGEDVVATLNDKAYTELSNAEISSGMMDKAEEGDAVYLVGDANLTTAIGEGVTLEVLKNKMLTIDAVNCSILFTGEGTIRVNASGAISVEDTKMIGGNNANIIRNGCCRRHVARWIHGRRLDQQLCAHGHAVGKQRGADHRKNLHNTRPQGHGDPRRSRNHPDALL